jgi:hypothetical protein
MMVDLLTTILASPETVFTELDGGAAILDLKSGSYFKLNSTGTYVWSLLQEPRTIEELSKFMQDRFNVAKDQVDVDLSTLIGELTKHELVTISE